ncbi:MbcA/ParS/Xre antitoxin family protein [Ovoidimarina sediminis]|uniref:MbcA/ParS/Xre antitoxin family protein n=1 Tax=Ovoidimarina sediminis TaxID=3079856 RepID=UPI002913B748|nr:MbcA/ParS/Xre antitoxin family protein [Rhodophyticola sp. MJ-SS7]MDU8945698.1 MbcA/ParS/Xre antitoxin family protein [Rhodophyticola sp. MJ-SS7]
MVLPSRALDDRPDPGAVLTRAALRAAALLGLTARELAGVLGLSEPTVSRMKSGGYCLDEASKSFELAALFVRLFRSLDAITGDAATARAWIRAENTALGGKPVDKIATIAGLTDVVAYLDARRAPL